MRAKRAFLYSFTVSFIVMGACLGVLWAGLEINSMQAGTPAPKVAMVNPGAEDSKTILIKTKVGRLPQYYLLKLNAIENKVGLVAISPRYKGIDQVSSLQGMGAARDMLKAELGVFIDYYLAIGEEQLRQVCRRFCEVEIDGIEMPAVIRGYLLKNAQMADADSVLNRVRMCAGPLDSQVGLEFLGGYVMALIRANLVDNMGYAIKQVRNCYSYTDTDMNTNSLDRMEIIARFLSKGTAECRYGIIAAEEEMAREKVEKIFGV